MVSAFAVSGTRAAPRPRRSARALILAWALASAGCTGDSPNPFSEAEALASRGLEVEAARVLDRAVREAPEAERGEYYDRIARYYHAGSRWERALEAAADARRHAAGSPDLRYIEGDSLRELSRLDEAEEVLDELVSSHPSHAPGKLSLARLRFRTEDATAALALFESSIDDPSVDGELREEALLEYGRALRAAGRYQEAADRFASLLESRPRESSLYSELAATLYRMKKRRQARLLESIYRTLSQSAFEEDVQEKLERSGMGALAISQGALNLERRRRYLAALRRHRAALENDRSDPRVSLYCADLCLELARHREALEVLDRALELDVRPASGLWSFRGIVLLEQQDWSAALSSFRNASRALSGELDRGLRGGPEKGQAEPFTVALGTGRARLELGELTRAWEVFSEEERTAPGAWEPHFWKGRVQLARNEPREALASFQRARGAGGPDHGNLPLFTAVALARYGKKEEALGLLSAVARREPWRVRAYEEMLALLPPGDGRAKSVAERRDEIRGILGRIDELEAAIQTTPLDDSAPLYAELGRHATTLGKPGALAFLLVAAALDPSDTETTKILVARIVNKEDVFVRLRFLRRLLDAEPDSTLALRGLATIYLALHIRLDEADRCAERLAELEPGPVSSRILGEIRILRGRTAEGLRILEEAARKYPGDAGLRKALETARGG